MERCERIDEKVKKIKSKFLSEEEELIIGENQKKLVEYWSMKETAYKVGGNTVKPMLLRMTFVQRRTIIIEIVKTINEIYMNRTPLLLTLSIIMMLGVILTVLFR